MEPKKVKKLVISKETISVLNDYEKSKYKGGSDYMICPDYSNGCIPETHVWEKTCLACSVVCSGDPICDIPWTSKDIPCPTPSGYYTFCPCPQSVMVC